MSILDENVSTPYNYSANFVALHSSLITIFLLIWEIEMDLKLSVMLLVFYYLLSC